MRILRETKDDRSFLFRYFFDSEKMLHALYVTLSHNKEITMNQVEFYDLDGTIMLTGENDKTYLIEDKIINFYNEERYETALTFRALQCLSGRFDSYIKVCDYENLNIYKSRGMEYIVFYNGGKNAPKYKKISLKDIMSENKYQLIKDSDMDAKLINITHKDNLEAFKNCTMLYEYSLLLERINSKLSLEGYISTIVNSLEAFEEGEYVLSELTKKEFSKLALPLLRGYKNAYGV